MIAVPESNQPDRVRSSKSFSPKKTTQSLPRQWQNKSQKQTTSVPAFVRILLLFQQTSAMLTWGAVATTLVMYGLNVYTQELWNREHRQLQNLQRQERTVAGLKESLKDEIVESGNLRSDEFVPITPEKNIYLEPAMNSQEAPHHSSSIRQVISPQTDRPLAY